MYKTVIAVPDDHGISPFSHVARKHLPAAQRIRAILSRGFAKVPVLPEKHSSHAASASRISSRSQISTSAAVSSSIIASVWCGPGVKRRRSVPRGTVGKLIGCT